MGKAICFPNFYDASAAGNTGLRTSHENSVVRRVHCRDDANVFARYENKTAGNLTIHAEWYVTSNDLIGGTVAASGVITNGYVIPTNSYCDLPVTGLPLVETHGSGNTYGTRPIFYGTRYDAASSEYMQVVHTGSRWQEKFESAATSGSLTNRSGAWGAVATVPADRWFCYGPSIVYGDDDSAVALFAMGDSNNNGFADTDGWGPLMYLCEELNLPGTQYGRNSSTFGVGYVAPRGSAIDEYRRREILHSHVTYLFDINNYNAMTDPLTATGQAVSLWTDVTLPGFISIHQDLIDNFSESLKFIVLTYMPAIADNPQTASGQALMTARIVGNQTKRDAINAGTYPWISYWDVESAFENPADRYNYRTDLGNPGRLDDNLHLGDRGPHLVCAAVDSSHLGINKEPLPVLHPPYTVTPEGFIECNVLCHRSADVTLPKGASGMTFHYSGGDVTILGGHVIAPTNTTRRFVATARLYPSRQILPSETLTSITVGAGVTIVNTIDDRTAIATPIAESGDYPNNSVASLPAAVGTAATQKDVTFSSGSDASDLAAYYAYNGTGAIVGGKYRLISPQSAVYTAHTYSLTPGTAPRVRVTAESLDWAGNLIMGWGFSTQYDGGTNNGPGYNEYLNAQISDTGGGNYAVTFYAYGLGISPTNHPVPGFVPSNNNRFILTIMPSTTGNQDRALLSIYDVTASTYRLQDYLFEYANSAGGGIGGGSRPQTTGSWRIGFTCGATAQITHLKIESLVPDTTPPTVGSTGWISKSGGEAIIQVSTANGPILPAPGSNVDGFTISGKTIDEAITFGDFYILLNLADVSRIALSASNPTATYTQGGTVPVKNAYSTAAITAAGITLTNFSEWSGSADAVGSVTIDQGDSSVRPGATLQLSATVAGSGTFSHAVNWTVQSGTGSISSSGLFSAPIGATGTAVVRATSQDNNSIYDEVTLTFRMGPQPGQSMQYDHISNAVISWGGGSSDGGGISASRAAQMAQMSRGLRGSGGKGGKK